MDQNMIVPWKPASSTYEPSIKQRREQIFLKPFADEQMRQENAHSEYQRIQLLAAIHMRDKQHGLVYNVFHKQWRETRLKEMYDFALHTLLMDSWKNLEQQEYGHIVLHDDQECSKKVSEKMEESTDVGQEIEMFERKGYELGADSKSTTPDGKSNEEKPIVKLKEAKASTKAVKGVKKKQQELPEVSVNTVDHVLLVQQGKAYYEEVKARNDKKAQERSEQQAKHEQEWQEQLQRQKELKDFLQKQKEEECDKKNREEALCRTELLLMAKAEEQSLTAYRQHLQEQIVEQRNHEWNAVLACDHELLLMMQQDHAESFLQQQRLWQEERFVKAEMKRKKHTEMCFIIISQIVQLSENASMYKENTDTELSQMEWHEWKKFFVKGAVLPSPFGGAATAAQPKYQDSAIADEESTMDYVEEKGEWSQPQLIGKNNDLGLILSQLHSVAYASLRLPQLHFPRDMKLKLSVVGPPYSGKTTVAKHLASEFGIVHIEVDKVVASAIAAASTEGNLVDCADTINKDPLGGQTLALEEKSCLGKNIISALANGHQVPDDLVVQLILLTISSLKEDGLGDSPQKKTIRDAPKASPEKSASSIQKRDKETATSLVSEGGKDPKKNVLGFVLDGFPSTALQAEILEKGLTGLDLICLSRYRDEASILAPPPAAETGEKLVSGLDSIFILEPPDDSATLKIALGKRVDPKTGLTYHLDYDLPSANDRTGIISRLKPMEEPESVRHRIVEGVAIWAEMLNWMNKFENVDMIGRDEQNKIKSDYALDLAKEILDAKIYLDGTVAAAEIAKEAESLATQALGEAEKASLGANLAAEQLQKSKTAELEATTILESFSSDPLARELLKNKASQIIAQRLNEAVKALKEVQDAADVAQRAARQAKSASESTQQAAVNASKLVQAKEEAEVAALAAKQASARATLASEKAVMAYESAVQIVNAIDVGGKKVDVLAKDHLVSPMSKSNQESRAQFGSDGVPSQPPSSTPVDVVQQSLTIDPKIADSVFRHWKEIESQYLTSVKDVLRILRMERWKSCSLLKQVKEEFIIFLKREDPKQQIFDEFQGKYNRVEPPQRRNTKMKAKLQAATEELGIKLRSFCDSNLKEAQEKCTKELEEWLKQSKLKLVAVFTSFIQIELQRFLETCNFLHEYIYAPASSSVNVFKTSLDAPKATGPPPKTFPFPGWLSSIMASSPDLHQVLAQALYTSDNLSKSMAEQTNIEKSSKSALKKTKPLSRSTKDNVTNDLQVVDQKVKAISDADILATKGSAKLQAISREFDLLPAHLQLIARKGCAYIYELQLLKGNAYKQMDGWMQKLFQKEVDVVLEVTELTKAAMEEGIPLWFRMVLNGGDLCIQEDQLVTEPPTPLGLSPVLDLNCWHYKILENLVESFKIEFPKGYADLDDVQIKFFDVIEKVHTECKKDIQFAEVPHLPGNKYKPFGPFQVWKSHVDEILRVPLEKFHSEVCRMIDWRIFVISLLDVHFNNCISSSTVEEISRACIVMEDFSKESKGCITMQNFLDTSFWFEVGSLRRSLDVGYNVKKLVLKVVKGDEELIPWKQLLLYLCRDEILEAALMKVFRVLCGTSPTSLELRVEELLQAAYPSGMEGARAAGCMSWTNEGIKQMIKNVIKERTFLLQEGGARGSRSSLTNKINSNNAGSTLAQKGSQQSEGTTYAIVDSSLTNSEDPEDEAELGYGFSKHAVVAISQFLQDCNADKNFSNEKRDCQEDGNMAHDKHSKSDEILSEGDSIVLEFLECNLANPTIVATDAHKIADVDGKGENFGCEITLQDLLTAPAAVNFCSSLFANYGSKCIIPSLQVQSGPL